MTSSILPYNLRTNKAIDRSIFIEFLIKMNKYQPIDQYTYIGFGATHLEDFKQIHTILGLNKLISIEQDKSIHMRQLFNKPISCIDLRRCSSGEFIQSFDFDENCIIWLDYVSPKQINEQIREFQSVIEKCGIYDIIKVSINSNPDTLGNQSQNEDRDITLQKRLDKLKSRISVFLDEDITSDDMTIQGLPNVLLGALINAANQITRRDDKKFFPVSSFVYTDINHQMLTLTGVLLDKSSDFINDIQLENWKYSFQPDQKIYKINIPDLTLKERLIINSKLPTDTHEEIISELGYQEIPSFEAEVENYVQYYRHFPSFSKVII
ncbi:O-methyltransferase [Paenibacillus yanchengensis]|uniref:O-methyltransferase n=1 Tax=Paenibacillus yanchengensis TaxID=2035833 RepID=A0ABW4YGH0_9BACL